MYTAYYGLKENPFTISPDPRYFFLGSGHKRALAYLNYGISSQKGFIVITGEIGSGKTTLIRKILNDQDKKTKIAWIINPKLSPFEFIQTLLQNFGITRNINNRVTANNELINFLKEQNALQNKTVLIVDEAQNMDLNLMEEVRLLSNFESATNQILQIILMGQPELNDMLQNPKLKQLNQRISVKFHLAALKEEEIKEYITHRLKVGGTEINPFTDQTIKKIYKVSGGIPRIINIICDAALLFGYAEELKEIEVDLIDEIIGELNISPDQSREMVREEDPDQRFLHFLKNNEEKLNEISRKVEELSAKQMTIN